jgi:hypothetical protein
LRHYLRNHATGDDDDSGLTWDLAKKTLDAAINAAGEYYQIWVRKEPTNPANRLLNLQRIQRIHGQNGGDGIAVSERFEGANSTKARPSFEEAMSDPRRNKFYIDKPLAIYGGFSGSGLETELDQRNWRIMLPF